MPIRRELRPLYRGPAWRAIRERILARANHQCERCGVPNHQNLLRRGGWWTPLTRESLSYELALPWRHADVDGVRVASLGSEFVARFVFIVLTIAHLNHRSRDNRDDNLQALCQWCHLRHDRKFHFANSRRTRAKRAGQQWLSADLELTEAGQ